MENVIASAKHLRELLGGIVVNDRAAEVLHSLKIIIDEQLKKIKFQPAAYLIYANKQIENSTDNGTVLSLATTSALPKQGDSTIAAIATGSNTVKVVANGGQNENTGAVVVSQFTNQRTSKHKEEEMRYKCAFCDYKAHRKFMVQKHMVYHTGEKPYACDHCDYRVAYKSDLKKHMRKHTGERPYSCGVCSQTFKQAAGLRSHSLLHTGEKPYKCAYCDFRSVQSSSVKTHVAVKHLGEKRYSCRRCCFITSGRSTLLKHVERKHPDELFRCSICDFTSPKQMTVTQHYRASHTSHSVISDGIVL